MPTINAKGIQIEYDTFGSPSSPALLLIMGLGGQLIHWNEAFCRQLAQQDLFVIRYDSRDTGLSTKFEDAGLTDISELFESLKQGKAFKAPYTLEDLADDAIGLLEALNIEAAHICGASMGGMIAQVVALRHPQRLLSLISIYSTTGNPQLPPPQPEAMETLMEPPPTERRAYIDFVAKTWRIISGSGFPFDEEYARTTAAQAYDRSFYPQGVGRQLAAVLNQKDRRSALASVTVPTLVIHGSDDPLVPDEHGKDTADAIPGADLLLIEGMGHDLPQAGGPWPQIVEAIGDHIKRV
ncbi:MAG: alpha/beta fold hydrolase [Desulfobacterales bacterium]|jgi:pimeloyl-ACP methyl ester carboxylesterase